MRLVFMGTPEFAVPSLELLIASGYTPVAVATAPDKPRGRGLRLSPSPVKAVALAHGLPVLQPESVKDPAFAQAVAECEADVHVVVAFRILPPDVYESARLGAFNLHASLLPAFRGAAPIQRALMAGVTETGVTTFFLKRQVDTGDMILQERLSVGPDETAGELHDRLMELGARAVLETVRRIEAGTAHPVPQDDRLATPAPKIFPDDCRIPWDRSAHEVHNHVRALSPHPGAWTHHGADLVKIYRTMPLEGAGQPGQVIGSDHSLVVACARGAVDVLELQVEGRRRMPAESFLRGYPIEAGSVLS